jgi:hypothetical protein
MKTRITQSQIKRLLALKRAERPPENFFVDFIQEFHRRMDAAEFEIPDKIYSFVDRSTYLAPTPSPALFRFLGHQR